LGHGRNDVGQLGDGTTNSIHMPEQIVSSGVIAIAAGRNHSLFLKSDHSLWGMGYNYDGELGDGAGSISGLIYQPAGANRLQRCRCDLRQGTAIACLSDRRQSLDHGWQHSRGAWRWHSNPSTNRPEQIVSSGVVAVAAGKIHDLFIKSDGSLWTMGANNAGWAWRWHYE